MRRRFHLLEDSWRLSPWMTLINWFQPRFGDRLVHFFELLPRADIDSADVCLLVQDHRNRNGLRRPAQHADLRDHAAHFHRAQRTRQRAHTTYLDYKIRALAIGLLNYPPVPLRRL